MHGATVALPRRTERPTTRRPCRAKRSIPCLTKEIESDVLVAFVTRAGISEGALERLGHLGRECADALLHCPAQL